MTRRGLNKKNTVPATCLINAQTGQVERAQIQMSGNPSNQELTAADRRKPFSNLKLYFVTAHFPFRSLNLLSVDQ